MISAPILDMPASRLSCAPSVRYWDEKMAAATKANAKTVAMFRYGLLAMFRNRSDRNRN
jgi:hypothetical protein